MRYLLTLAVLLPLAALAQSVVPGGELDALALLTQALQQGPGGVALAVAAALVGLVQVARRLGGSIHPWLGTGQAAAILSAALGLLGALVTTLAAGQPLTLAVVLNGLLAALTASGIFSASKAVISRAEDAGATAAAAGTATKAAQIDTLRGG